MLATIIERLSQDLALLLTGGKPLIDERVQLGKIMLQLLDFRLQRAQGGAVHTAGLHLDDRVVVRGSLSVSGTGTCGR